MDISSNPLQDWMDERNELRIRRQEAEHRCDVLRAENERLQRMLASESRGGALLIAEVEQQDKQVERLRAALRNLLAYTVKANVYTDRSPTIHEAEDALGDACQR